MEYHELNSTFEHEGKVLKVIKSTNGCKGCYFADLDCDGFKCDITERSDNKSVIFELQGEIVVPEKTEGLNILEAAQALSMGFGIRRKGTNVSVWASRDVDGKPMINSQIVSIIGEEIGDANFQVCSLLANDWEIIK
ncbi:MAG: hypothetical protein RR490_01630 [Niameybacter sp.]